MTHSKELIQKNKLQIRRKHLGLLQIDVAKVLGWKDTTMLSRWEKGKGIPGLVNLFKLCAIYRSYPEELYPDLFQTLVSSIRSKKLEIIADAEEAPIAKKLSQATS